MQMRLLRCATACACVAAGVLASAAQAPAASDTRPVRPLESDAPLSTQRLSDERNITRFANAVALAAVRREPSPGAAIVARLHYRTEDGPLETYMALESRVDAAQRTWVHIRIPGRPNGRTGWVPRYDLGRLKAVRTRLVVDRARLRATLYREGRRIWSSPAGIGKPSTPTPAGHFWIRNRLRGLRGGDPVYGPYAFGSSAYSVLSDWPGGGVIGIHGTNEPDLIPGRPSHGCIRLPNAAITRLYELMPVGTPVRIV
jgi:L,D-transpeptidase catalytic domain